MKALTKQETIEALKGLFDYETHKENRDVMVSEKDGSAAFMVHKTYLDRYEVIGKLQEFFSDKYIVGGQCRVDGITLVWTMFHIEDRVATA